MVLMESMPPATTTSASPSRSDWLAIIIAFMPEGHAMFREMAGTRSGRPAKREAERAGFTPLPAWRQSPRITSSTASGETPARETASRTTVAPRS